jgi:hypothetical protein
MFLEVNENENTTYQNLCDTANLRRKFIAINAYFKKIKRSQISDLRGKFIAINAYFKKIERSQISDLMVHLKLLDKQEQVKPKKSRRREIIKIRVEINEIETKK